VSDALPLSYLPSPSADRSFRTSAHADAGARPTPSPLVKLPLGPRPAPAALRSTAERMRLARERIHASAEEGRRMRSYEVALDLDMSEFHFARQFRLAFGRSPHVYYDEVRAARARALLAEGEVARRIGFRRPAELRALLSKRGDSAAA
jgi:AraC-like DNA-binding protein